MKKVFLSGLMFIALSGCLVDEPRPLLPDNRIMVLRDEKTGRLVAQPKQCPTWNHELFDGLENQAPQRYGCADMYNLGLMVANPADLVKGRTPDPADANTGILGVERYRSDKKKNLINPKDISATGGASQ